MGIATLTADELAPSKKERYARAHAPLATASPRNRFIQTPSCEDMLNYLCDGHKALFLHLHIDGKICVLTDLVRQRRHADANHTTAIIRPHAFCLIRIASCV